MPPLGPGRRRGQVRWPRAPTDRRTRGSQPKGPARAARRRARPPWSAGRTRPPATSAASADAPAGTTMCSLAIAATRDAIPGTGRTVPSRPSSPTKPVRPTQAEGSTSAATSSPMAMGRSSPAPVFRTPDGARFTVTRREGHVNWLDNSAAPDAVARLAHRRVGQPDDGKAGETGRDMNFDEHRATVHPVEGGRGYASQHGRASSGGGCGKPRPWGKGGPPCLGTGHARRLSDVRRRLYQRPPAV